jgi:alpha-methylacyl-CoA racemase
MGPLVGLRVIELTGFGPGPMAGMMLADHGADVIRVERPGDSWFEIDPRYLIHQRGKRLLSLNLKAPRALEILMRLIETADIVLEGFRPGVAERVGFGPELCLNRNPRLIYARITGYGQTGPLASHAGHDLNYIATTGALSAIGEASRPPVPPLNLLADFGAGAMYALFGVLSALYERQSSGRGQVIDVSMAEAVISLQTSQFGYLAAGLLRPERNSNQLDGGAPYYTSYAASDGHYVSVAALEPQFFAALSKQLDLDSGWLQWRHERARWPELRSILADKFRQKTRAQWCELLGGGDNCFSPVLSLGETSDYPQFKERGSVTTVDGIAQPGIAPRFDRSTGDSVRSVPKRGADIQSILKELGTDSNSVEDLRAAGDIG